MRLIVRAFLVCGVVAVFALPAAAKGGDVAGGYSYVNDSDLSTSFPAGWFFSAGANLSDIFAVVGDISGNYKSETATVSGTTATASLSVHTFLAGPRVVGRSGRLAVYGQFLVGAARASGGVTATGGGANISVSDSQTEFCYLPGAGVDIDLSRNGAVRVGVNERLIRSDGGTSKEFQLIIGLAYRFGK